MSSARAAPADIEIVSFAARRLAVAEALVLPAEIPSRIRQLFDAVYAWERSAEVSHSGLNHALYRMEGERLRMQVGFPVSAAFADAGEIRCLSLPEARAAHLRHQGAYSGLGPVHQALIDRCAAAGHPSAGVSAEVYGHHAEREADLVTDVYLLLA